MAERRVLVQVKIATEGKRFCARRDRNGGGGCPWLGGDLGYAARLCSLFNEHTVAHARVPACLALDGGGVGEPNGVGDA